MSNGEEQRSPATHPLAGKPEPDNDRWVDHNKVGIEVKPDTKAGLGSSLEAQARRVRVWLEVRLSALI
jgi:hypothetical protein